MKRKMLYLAAFSLGAAVGSVVTWYVVKKKEEQRADEEINSMKEYHDKVISHYKEDLKAAQDYIDNEIDNVSGQEKAILNYEGGRTDYTQYAAPVGKPVTEEPEEYDPDLPYMLDSADEYGENEMFDTEVLYYTSDGVLADMDGNIIEDVKYVVGLDAIETFGDEALERFGDEDAVYVRNERMECDYEILQSPDTYDTLFSDGY